MKMKKLIILLILILTFTGCGFVKDAPDVATIGIHPNTTIKTLVCDPSDSSTCASTSTDLENTTRQMVDATTPNFERINHFFDQSTGDTSTLNGTVLINTNILNLTDATGFIVGEFVSLFNGTTHLHGYRKILGVSGNTLTLDSPVDITLPDGSLVENVIFNMNVDGSVIPSIFEIQVPAGQEMDLTRLLVQMVDNTEPDDSRFGGGAALTRGVHIRKNFNNGEEYETLAIWRQNKDLKEDMFDVSYSSKAGGGNWGVSGRWTLTAAETTVALDGSNNETLEAVIQDDLTGLIDFQIKVQGHFDN